MLSGWAGWHRLHWGRDNPYGASQISRAFGQEPKRLQHPRTGATSQADLSVAKGWSQEWGTSPTVLPTQQKEESVLGAALVVFLNPNPKVPVRH